MLVLSGDLGGTNFRANLHEVDASATTDPVLHRQYRCADYVDTGFTAILRDFLATSEAEGVDEKPIAGCFSVAGPIVNNACQMTNLPWYFSGDEMAAELGASRTSASGLAI
jgi:glucokinase